MLAGLVTARVIGKGPDGYREALELPGGSASERARRAAARAAGGAAARHERLQRPLPDRLRRARTRRSSSSPSGCGSSATSATREAAREARGRRVHRVPRNLFAGRRGGAAPAGSGSRRARSPYAAHETLAEARPSSCRDAAWSRRCARSRTRASWTRSGARRRSRDGPTRGSRRSRSWAAPRRELAWRMFELMKEAGADWVAFPSIVATGPNGALPHAEPGRRASCNAASSWSSTPARASAATAPTARARSRPASSPPSCRSSTRSAWRRSSPALEASGPA